MEKGSSISKPAIGRTRRRESFRKKESKNDFSILSGERSQPIPVLLMLPETERIIAERGYTGIKKHLYTSYVELKKLLFLSAENFAALHDNFDDEQFQARVTRTRVVKAIIGVLVVATVVTVAIALPWTFPGLVAVVANIAVLAAVAASSTAFFGIIVHVASNMVEDFRFKKTALRFTAFKEEYIDEKIEEYKSLPADAFAEDTRFLVGCRDEIIVLFNNPSAYENGLKLKSKLQFLMELYYINAMHSKNQECADSLLELFYGIYNTLDSVVLQEALINNTFTEEWFVSGRQSEILNFHFGLNDRIFSSGYQDSDRVHRTRNQSAIARQLLRAITDGSAGEDLMFNKFINTKKYGTVSKQIFMDEYIKTLHRMPIEYFIKKPEMLAYIKNSYKYNSTFPDIFKDMHRGGVSAQVGSLHMKAIVRLKTVYEILTDNKLPIEYRLYALITISKMGIARDSLKDLIMNPVGRILDSEYYGKQLIDNELAAELAEKSEAFLDNIAKRKNVDSGNDYLNAVETEMVYAALAVIERNNNEKVDPVELLKRIAYVFGKKLNVEVAIKLIGNNVEIFNIPLKSGKKYVDAVRNIIKKLSYYF